MFKISTRSQYGLRAMVYLAKTKNKISSLKVISKSEGISFDYLEKIISRLEKTGLIKAKKGVQGGYFLGKSASKIKLSEIIKALEGDKNLVKCIKFSGKKVYCSREKKCLTRMVWKKIQDSLTSTLNAITLADLIEN